jgi:hypothetical protein
MAESQTRPRESGIRFRCECGAELLIAAKYIGQVKHCPKCQATFTVPAAESLNAKPLSSRRTPQISLSRTSAVDSVAESCIANEATCAVCQCSLLPDDDRTLCPECGLPHHTDCWNENFGCSAYGCGQVNALKPGPDIQIGSGMLGALIQRPAPPPVSVAFANETNSLWEYAFLVASVVGFLLGVVTYGVPCFLAGTALVAFVFSRGGRVNWKALAPAGLICLLGFVIGVLSSSHIYTP